MSGKPKVKRYTLVPSKIYISEYGWYIYAEYHKCDCCGHTKVTDAISGFDDKVLAQQVCDTLNQQLSKES